MARKAKRPAGSPMSRATSPALSRAASSSALSRASNSRQSLLSAASRQHVVQAGSSSEAAQSFVQCFVLRIRENWSAFVEHMGVLIVTSAFVEQMGVLIVTIASVLLMELVGKYMLNESPVHKQPPTSSQMCDALMPFREYMDTAKLVPGAFFERWWRADVWLTMLGLQCGTGLLRLSCTVMASGTWFGPLLPKIGFVLCGIVLSIILVIIYVNEHVGGMQYACAMHCAEECGCLGKASFGLCTHPNGTMWFLGIPIPRVFPILMNLPWTFGVVKCMTHGINSRLDNLFGMQKKQVLGLVVVVHNLDFCDKTLSELGGAGKIHGGVQVVLSHSNNPGDDRADDWFPKAKSTLQQGDSVFLSCKALAEARALESQQNCASWQVACDMCGATTTPMKATFSCGEYFGPIQAHTNILPIRSETDVTVSGILRKSGKVHWFPGRNDQAYKGDRLLVVDKVEAHGRQIISRPASDTMDAAANVVNRLGPFEKLQQQFFRLWASRGVDAE